MILVLLALSQAPARLTGLERFYFEPVAITSLPREVAAHVPERLEAPRPPFRAPEELRVRDVRIPGVPSHRARWIREIVSSLNPRISEIWWVLYSGGRRGDAWTFSARPDRTDSKMLANYHIESAGATARGVTLRLSGDNFRPGGMWTLEGKTLLFTATDSGLTFVGVRGSFSLHRSYLVDDTVGTITAIFEQVRGDEIEHRLKAYEPGTSLPRCGFRDPTEGPRLSWVALERVTRCLAAARDAAVSRRPVTAPSFAERGGGQ